MNLYQFNWKVAILKGIILFFEGDRKIGEVSLFGLFSTSCIAYFRNEKYILHSEILTNNRIRIFNASNDKELAILKFKLWNSSANLVHQNQEYSLRSSFFGISSTYWTQKDSNRILTFDNHILKGKVSPSFPDNEMYQILIIAAIQSMMIYSFLFLLMLIVVFYVIL